MPLSGEDIGELSKALSSTLDFNDLERMVHATTGDRLFVEYVGTGKPLRPTIVDLLNALEQRGITPLFLRKVYTERPYRQDVRAVITALCPEAAKAGPDDRVELSAQRGGVAIPELPNDALAPGLQRNIRSQLPQVDLLVWLDRLLQIKNRVCRIEISGRAAGTGFLVGPEAVLTNWHVVEQAKAAGKLGAARCRFDYMRLADGTRQSGVEVPLHSDGVLDDSPYSPAELTEHPENPLPRADELDYALLRLAQRAGDHPVEDGTRGWLTPPDTDWSLAADAPLLIVQHPDGAPMKLAMDTQSVIGANQNGTRVRYRTNTDPGSSGSPCFSMGWDLVALHHFGDPAWQAPKFNQGVPIGLIRRSVVARGLGGFLGS